MKNTIFPLVIILMTVALLTNCNSSTKKAEAQKKVLEIKDAIAKANLELNILLKDSIQQFKKESEEKTMVYEKNLAENNAFAAYEKREAKIKTEMKMTELEQKNNEMIKRLTNYKESGIENYELFRYELGREMDEQDKSIKASNI